MTVAKKTIVKAQGRIVGQDAAKASYRVVSVGGRTVKKRVIDPERDDFTAQFTSGFRNSVKRAREENRELERRA